METVFLDSKGSARNSAAAWWRHESQYRPGLTLVLICSVEDWTLPDSKYGTTDDFGNLVPVA